MKGVKSKSKGDNKLSVKKSAGKKPAKDPNMPKRPSSAFFVFMEEFRKSYKEKHPNNKSVAVVGKAGGAKWKSMSDEEKAPYVEKAEKRKTQYEKDMKAYNKKQTEGTKSAAEEEGESEKSQSEVEDDDEDGSAEEEDDE